MTGGGGIVVAPADASLRVLLRAAESDGELGAVEMEMTPGTAGPPLHRHPTHGEGFYVLAGRPTLRAGDDVIVADPGTWVFAPRGAPHTLANHGPTVARLLCVFAPGGFERRFERILADAAGTAPPEQSQAELATEMIGPPLVPPA